MLARIVRLHPILTILAVFVALGVFVTARELVMYQLFDRGRLESQADVYLKELEALKKQDQYLINKDLSQTIGNIEKTYDEAVDVYEDMLDVGVSDKQNEQFATILSELSDRNWATASSLIATLKQSLAQQIAQAEPIPSNVLASNTPPPAGGYSRQSVQTEAGTFLVDIISSDLGSTRVIVDTASERDCGNDCPVLSLADYVGRNGAFAGVNGSYFCPASYPSCAGKTNTFDTLLMNKNKVYFNSDNNVYSTVPAVIFGSGWIRFVGRSLDWGRDTGVDGVIANQPLLVAGGNVVFGGDDDPKKGSKGNRSFVSNKGNIVYIGVVRSATVAESARVMKALGMENALNLDDGGSTALWSGGYKVGPGRNIPNAILFVRK